MPPGVAHGLAAASLWGVGDLAARLASDRVGSRTTAFFVQLLSMAALLVVLALWPAAAPPRPSPQALGLAAAVGALNATGLLLFYRALEIGTVSLVSPIASSFAVISTALSLLGGERPSAGQLAGMLLTLVGVAGASAGTAAGGAGRRGLSLAVISALCWGVSFYLLRFVVADLGPVLPVLAARATMVAGLGAAALLGAARLGSFRPATPWILLCAGADTGAFVAYNAGLQVALTSIVSVLSSLFSAVTVLLARVFLRERLSRPQQVAVGAILVGVGLVSGG